jgi:hypothetical protein
MINTEKPKEQPPEGMRWCLTDDDIVCFKNGRCVAVNIKPWKLEKESPRKDLLD